MTNRQQKIEQANALLEDLLSDEESFIQMLALNPRFEARLRLAVMHSTKTTPARTLMGKLKEPDFDLSEVADICPETAAAALDNGIVLEGLNDASLEHITNIALKYQVNISFHPNFFGGGPGFVAATPSAWKGLGDFHEPMHDPAAAVKRAVTRAVMAQLARHIDSKQSARLNTPE